MTQVKLYDRSAVDPEMPLGIGYGHLCRPEEFEVLQSAMATSAASSWPIRPARIGDGSQCLPLGGR